MYAIPPPHPDQLPEGVGGGKGFLGVLPRSRYIFDKMPMIGRKLSVDFNNAIVKYEAQKR